MNPLFTVWLVCTLLGLATSYRTSNAISNNMSPTEWLPLRDLESLSPLNEISFEQLQQMPAEEGADLVNKIYHLSQISKNFEPSYAPDSNDIPAYTFTATGQRINFKWNQFVSTAKQLKNFGQEEVTIFITGLPEQQLRDAAHANQKLIQAYLEAYSGKTKVQRNQYYDFGDSSDQDDSSSQEMDTKHQHPKISGNLVVVNLGDTLMNMAQLALFDINKVGIAIGNTLAQLIAQTHMPHDAIHVVAQGIAAQVAGAAARQFTHQTGKRLRRITALDPSKIYARKPNTLIGLARGSADFVDAIHTSSYGMGTTSRVGDVDFYPNGPSAAMPGTKNIVEAALRATRYYAESVRPGNEHNFPAAPADSLQQYKKHDSNGRRGYMGIAADYDLEGDYMLQVNAKAPFGQSAGAKKQMEKPRTKDNNPAAK